MEPLTDQPWEIPTWLYAIFAIGLALLYSWLFPRLQEWMANREK
jgi:F0F1-type ATP synthase membrane subunit b/b'